MSTLYRLVGVLLSVYASCSAMFGDGKFWVAGEGLLWRATMDASYYTILSPTPVDLELDSPKGNQIDYGPAYRGAYRISAGYRWCDTGLSVSWASFNTSYRSKVVAGPGQAVWVTEAINTGGNPNSESAVPQGTAALIDSFGYDVLDGEIGRWIRRPCACLVPYVAVGVRYARIDWNRQVELFASTGDLFQLTQIHSDNQGVGPRGTIGARYQLWQCIGAVAEGSLNLLIGSSKGCYYSDPRLGEEFVWQVHNKPFTCLIPALDARFGLDAHFSPCGCLTAKVGVGYELSHYWNGITRDYFYADERHSANIGLPRTFAVDGWYFRLAGEY